jgi:hypothetical protein
MVEFAKPVVHWAYSETRVARTWPWTHGVLRHLPSGGPGAPRGWLARVRSHWPRLVFSAKQTGCVMLRPPSPPHRLLHLSPPIIFANENFISSVVVANKWSNAVRKLPGGGRRTRGLRVEAEGPLHHPRQ